MKIRRLSPLTGAILVLISMVVNRFDPVFACWIYPFGLGPEISMFYGYGISALIMNPFLLKGLRQPKESLMAIGGSLMMGIGALGYFKALEVLPVPL